MKITLYAHRNKESNFDTGAELGLSDKVMTTFMYALCEVEFEVEVDELTGKVLILSVNKTPLVKPVEG